jgi:hypothetical protein
MNQIGSRSTLIGNVCALVVATGKAVKKALEASTLVVAVFGIACNLSFVVFVTYQEHYAGIGTRGYWGTVAILLAPSLVLFVFRHLWPVVFIYASIIFWILIYRVQYRYEDFFKWDTPAVILVFLGMISVVAVLLRAAVSFFALMQK